MTSVQLSRPHICGRYEKKRFEKFSLIFHFHHFFCHFCFSEFFSYDKIFIMNSITKPELAETFKKSVTLAVDSSLEKFPKTSEDFRRK